MPRDRVPRRDRLLVSYCLFVPLTTTALYYVTGLNEFGQIGRVATVLVLLVLAVPWRRRLARERLWSVFTFTLVLFGSWMVQPLVELFTGSPAAAFRGLRWALYTAIWCAPVWILSVTIHTLDDLRRAVRLADYLGVLVAGSVYVTAVAYSFGYRLGDVVETGETGRIFGPLGDMVTFCLLLFLLRELARRQWARFAFYLVPFLLGRTRGALLALAVGLAAYGVTQVAAAIRRARTGDLFLHVATCLVALAIVGAALAHTALGRRALERFETLPAFLDDHSLAGRLDGIWYSGQVFAAHPVLGVGPGGYQEVVLEQDLGWSHEDRPGAAAVRNRLALSTSVQNQLAHVATESGLVGLATFLPWCVLLLRTGQRATAVADPRLRDFMVGGQLFLVAILLGTQTATYLGDKSSIVFLVCVVAALAERATRAPAAVRRRGSLPVAWRGARPPRWRHA